MAVIASSSLDAEGYATHVLDAPYEGWVYNNAGRIRLTGQTVFQLVGRMPDGSDPGEPIFQTPPDLQTD